MNNKDIVGKSRGVLLTSCLFVASIANAQTNQAPPVLRAHTIEGQVLMLASAELAAGQVVRMDGVRMTVEIEGDFRVYRAIHKGKEHKVHVAREGRPRWLAFDPEESRFRDVLSSLRVELDDYGHLEEVVEAVDGVSGKAFEALGFAIVQLATDVNPAQAARRIQSHPEVKGVSIQLQGPIHVPM